MNTRFFIFASVATLAISGCTPEYQEASKNGLRSGGDLEKFASSASMFTKNSTDTVNASPATVRSRLAAYGAQCIHGRGIRTTTTRSMNGIPMVSSMEQHFQSGVTNEDGTPRFVIAQALGGGNILHINEGSKGFNVQLSSRILANASGGTTLSTVRSITFGSLYKSALKWARGETTTCPSDLGA